MVAAWGHRTGVGTHGAGGEVVFANSDLLSWMPRTTHSPGESGGGYKPLPRRVAMALWCRPRANPNQRPPLLFFSRSVVSRSL